MKVSVFYSKYNTSGDLYRIGYYKTIQELRQVINSRLDHRFCELELYITTQDLVFSIELRNKNDGIVLQVCKTYDTYELANEVIEQIKKATSSYESEMNHYYIREVLIETKLPQ